MLARAGTLPFLVLLLYATWLWARRLLPSQAAAVLAVAILATVPPILGHAALATLDVAAAATMLLALYAMQLWMTSGQDRDALLAGLAAGAAVATKFSAVPFLGLSLPALALLQWMNGRRARAAGCAAAARRRAPAGVASRSPSLQPLAVVLLVYTPARSGCLRDRGALGLGGELPAVTARPGPYARGVAVTHVAAARVQGSLQRHHRGQGTQRRRPPLLSAGPHEPGWLVVLLLRGAGGEDTAAAAAGRSGGAVARWRATAGATATSGPRHRWCCW